MPSHPDLQRRFFFESERPRALQDPNQFRRFDFGRSGGGNERRSSSAISPLFGQSAAASAPDTDFDLSEFLLEQNPRAAFFNAIRPFGTTPNRRRFFESQFDPFVDRFLGRVGEELQGGQFPELTFSNFLQDQDFGREFFNASASQRGQFGGGLNPRTRFLFGF